MVHIFGEFYHWNNSIHKEFNSIRFIIHQFFNFVHLRVVWAAMFFTHIMNADTMTPIHRTWPCLHQETNPGRMRGSSWSRRKYCRQNQLHCPELFYICDLNICIFRFAQEDPPPIYKTREKDDRPLDLFVSLNADDRVFLPYWETCYRWSGAMGMIGGMFESGQEL
jgi:hypothetical protein